MHIEGMEFGSSDGPVFLEPLSLEFDAHVNVFIGPNACGKTSLLYALAEGAPAFFQGERMTFCEIHADPGWESGVDYDELTDDQEQELVDNFGSYWHLKAVPWSFLPATRISLPGIDDAAAQYPALLGAGSSVNYPRLVDDLIDYLSDGHPIFHDTALPLDNLFVFNGMDLQALVEVMSNKLLSAGRAPGELERVQRVAYACAKDIALEVFVGEPWDYTSVSEDTTGTVSGTYPGMGAMVRTGTAKELQQEYVGHLSSGSQGLYLWILYIALKMAWHYKFDESWPESPAILLIDELENHLHPAWQRRVIPALRIHFRRLQIFATTHSPFVVAGLKAGQVHKLFRDENGIIRKEPNDEDLSGWTVEDILRAFMEIEDPADEDTAVAAVVLRLLRNHEPEEGETAEAWRQKRIAQLSGGESVPSGRDLVALGWLERLPTLNGAALDWWEYQIERLEVQVSPNIEFQGSTNADRERYIAQLEERLGENLLDD